MAFGGLINQEETIKRVDQKSMPFVANSFNLESHPLFRTYKTYRNT